MLIMNKFLEVKNVCKQYANHKALDDVSILIEQGTIFGLLGPNGAGKTSLIRIINRITAPDSGEVILDGEPIGKYDIGRIGYLPEERGLYRKMKVGEHAIYLARLKGVRKDVAKKRLTEWFDKFDIMPWWNKRVEELSKGMQQKIQFVCTVIHEPELLIFDEPFSGFDPINADLLKREIIELQRKGRTIIFSTHNMQSVEEICNDIALINSSKVVLNGNVKDIREQHSTGIVSIKVKAPFDTNTLDNINIISKDEFTDSITLRIKKSNGMTNIELAHLLPQTTKLISIEEEIPTMNEIFIKTVKPNEK